MNTTQNKTQYKNSPLGLIPEDWEVRQLNQIGVNVIDGDRGKNYPNENDFFKSEYCMFLNAKNVTKQGFSFLDTNFITKEKDDELRKGKLILNDIVLTTRGTVGNISFFDTSIKYKHLRINSGMVLIRNTKNELIENIFLYKCFTSFLLQQQIDLVSFGSAQPQLTVKEINKFKLPIPPLPEQTAIANCLSTWDKAIAAQTQLIAQKELRKKALMQQLLSGKKRLKGFSEEWKEVRLGDLGDTYNGLTGKSKEDFGIGFPFITYMNIFSNSRIDVEKVDFVKIDEKENQNKTKYGDIFFTVSSETPNEVGMTSVLLNEVDNLYLNSFCFGFRLFDFKTLKPEFAMFLLRSDDFRKEITILAQGSTRFNLSKTGVKKILLSLPSIEEQTAIANILQCADAEIQLLKKKLQQLQDQKKGVMQVLLTGKKRLKI